MLNYYKVKNVVHGIAHITGGGLLENVQRTLPDGVSVKINRQSWERPDIFGWLQRLGNIDDDEMDRVFNQGLGMVLIVSDYYADSIRRLLDDAHLPNWRIGKVVRGKAEAKWA